MNAPAESSPSSVTSLLRLRSAAVDAHRIAPPDSNDTHALERWMTLVSGGWSVVHAFDENGRRFLVARRTEPARGPRPKLSKRETEVATLAALGHSNKLIAYELGVTVHSVGTYLTRIKSKLGLNSRLDLVRLFGGGGELT